jgi:hypothetical protein
MDDINSISVTYDLSWEGCVGETDWVWDRFVQLSAEDGLASLPVASSQGNTWMATLRKETILLGLYCMRQEQMALL